MNINVTLFAQMVVFAALIWFSMKFVWPMVLAAMQEREQRIAEGLASADRAKLAENQAREQAETVMQEARNKASDLIQSAERQANDIVEQAKATAIAEGERLVEAAHSQIQQDAQRAREELRAEVSRLAIAGAEKILVREIDSAAHEKVLNDLVAKL
ncbi:MAG: F0F1 ATP synthase subunit B [Pseudomonadota bacterium]|nr:F0F1 ATP synthase subunit B [Pseudomonadota bacterium]